MKSLLIAAALIAALSRPVFAQESGPEPSLQESAAQTTEAAADEPAPLTRDEAKQKLRSKILELVESALDAADVEITDEIESEIEREFGGDRKIIIDGDADTETIGGLMIGALAIILIFGTPLMIVAAVLYAGYRKRRLVHDIISQYLASGKEVPPDIIQNLEAPATPKNYLQKGLVWTGVGLGIILCFLVVGSTAAASFGFIPLFIGLAQLLIWKLEQRGPGVQE